MNEWLSCQTHDRHLIIPGHQREFLHGKDYQALEQASQAVDIFTVLGGIQETTGSGTWCHGLIAKVKIIQRLDSMVLDIFSSIDGSVILWLAYDWHVKPLWLLCDEHMISTCWPHNCHVSCVPQACTVSAGTAPGRWWPLVVPRMFLMVTPRQNKRTIKPVFNQLFLF